MRAKLENACDPVFDEIFNKINPKISINDTPPSQSQISNKMEPYLESTNIDNIYAEPLRNIDTMKVLINVSFLNQDYKSAHKWIIV